MNFDWASAELERFLELTIPRNGSQGGFITLSNFSTYPREEVLAQWAVVKRILDRLYPTWEEENLLDMHYEFKHLRDAVVQCLSILKREIEMAENLGESGPLLRASTMHPWVWLAAGNLWRDGHYGSALQAAATSIDSQLQDKLGRRDISGKGLMNEAFSSQPPEIGKPRLRVPQMGNDESTRNAQDGLRDLAQSCVALIRNIRSHSIDSLSESEAIEQLATLSLLARMIDSCGLFEV